MKQRLRIVSAVILTLFLSSGPALAGGWGPYFSWGREEPSGGDEAAFGSIFDFQNLQVDGRLDHFSFGVLYDSAPAQDKLFSYRGTLGFDIATNTNMSLFGVELDLDETSKYGVSTKHTFAFAPVRTGRFKWWLGPSIGIKFNYYDDVFKDVLGQVGLGGFDLKAGHISAGGGGETGINLSLGSRMSFCFSGGVHWYAFGIAAGESVDDFVWGNGPLGAVKQG